MNIFQKLLVFIMFAGMGACVLPGCSSSGSAKKEVDALDIATVTSPVSVIIPNNAKIEATSSIEENGWSSKFLVDGKKDSAEEMKGWSSSGTVDNNHSKELVIDYKRIHYLDRIDLYPRNDKGFEGEFFPVDFTIEVSRDKEKWTTVAKRQDYERPAGVKSFRFAAQTARYIRITATKLRTGSSNKDEYRMQLAEVEAYYDNFNVTGTKQAKESANYYISSSTGDDSNNGLSPEKPWKTLCRASDMIFSAGNQILLKCGDTWENETLSFSGSGTGAKPILVSSYGDGDKPKIKAGFGAAHGIKLYNQSGIKITGLEFSDSASGILAVVEQKKENDFLWVENCSFHDITLDYEIDPKNIIMPYPELFFGSAVVVTCYGSNEYKDQTYYKNITVQKCSFDLCDSGITNNFIDTPMALDGYPTTEHRQFSTQSLLNVHISDVKVTRSYRSGGIFLYGAKDSVIENAFVDETGYEKGMYWGVAACQVSMCENVIVRNSEFSRTYRSNNSPDGEGFDFESGNKNVTLQNCYIHDNVGPAILFYGQNAGWRSNNADIVVDSCILENNGTPGTFDHSKVFKDYSTNTGLVKNNIIKLKFDAQSYSTDPLAFSTTNYVYDPEGILLTGPGITKINDNDTAIIYNGTWKEGKDSVWYLGDAHSTDSAGSSVELTFRGQTMKLLGIISPEGGKAEVYLDDQLDQVVDFKEQKAAGSRIVYEKTGLQEGIHKIKVVCKEGRIAVDAFDYYEGSTAPVRPKENLALNAKVSASSSAEGYGWSLNYIHDGVRNSLKPQNFGWSSNSKLDEDHTEWLQFDLGTVKEFDEIDMYLVDWSTSYFAIDMGLFFPVDFTVSVSEDGQKWQDIIQKTEYLTTQENNQRFRLDSKKSARYVRITGSRLRQIESDNNAYKMQLAEVEILNSVQK